jgi:cyclopropane-fatty-acyl-phospholipid synthase
MSFPAACCLRRRCSKSLGERFGVPFTRECIFGQDYAKALAIWRSNFRQVVFAKSR